MVWGMVAGAALGGLTASLLGGGRSGGNDDLKAAQADAIRKQKQMTIDAIKFSSEIKEIETTGNTILRALSARINV